jgi:hypothetical protein
VDDCSLDLMAAPRESTIWSGLRVAESPKARKCPAPRILLSVPRRRSEGDLRSAGGIRASTSVSAAISAAAAL